MSYVDGYVLVIPKKNRAKYKKIASDAGKIWKKCGAVAYFECVGEDMHPQWCKRPFPLLVKSKKNEEVWFSFIIYKNKAERKRVNAKVMKEMEKLYPDQKMDDMPFDMSKMSYGGFTALVEY